MDISAPRRQIGVHVLVVAGPRHPSGRLFPSKEVVGKIRGRALKTSFLPGGGGGKKGVRWATARVERRPSVV